MIEVSVGAEALGRSRFAVSPIAEMTNALEVLSHPGRAPFARRWVAGVAQRLRWSDYDVLLAIVEGAGSYVPDFLVPIPEGPEPKVEDEAAAVAATAPERVCRELATAFRGVPGTQAADAPAAHAPAADAPGIEAPGIDRRPALPPAVGHALGQLGESGLAHRLAEQLLRFWRAEMAELWPAVRAVLDDDVRKHVVAASREGFSTVVDRLHPDLSWNGVTVRMASDHQVLLDGSAGIVLMPSAFLPRPAVWAAPPSSEAATMVGYPALGRGRIWLQSGEAARQSAGAGLFAGRWAVLLRDLGVARTTGDLAARHGISPSTASYHLRRLHEAGLVTRRRLGHRVLYERTTRAADTLTVLDAG